MTTAANVGFMIVGFLALAAGFVAVILAVNFVVVLVQTIRGNEDGEVAFGIGCAAVGAGLLSWCLFAMLNARAW